MKIGQQYREQPSLEDKKALNNFKAGHVYQVKTEKVICLLNFDDADYPESFVGFESITFLLLSHPKMHLQITNTYQDIEFGDCVQSVEAVLSFTVLVAALENNYGIILEKELKQKIASFNILCNSSLSMAKFIQDNIVEIS